MELLGERIGTNQLILDIIFQYCDTDTKKACRLVNSTWLELVQKRLRLNNGLGRRTSNPSVATTTFEEILQSAVTLGQDRFFNFTLVDSIESGVIQLYGSSLRSLHLSFVSLSDISELETVLFDSFANMKDLVMWNVTVQDHNSEKQKEQQNNVSWENTHDLKTLTIKRYGAEEVEYDAIVALGLSKLFGRFRNIKELTYREEAQAEPLDVFLALKEAKVQLNRLYFDVFREWKSGQEYVDNFGGQLKHLAGNLYDKEQDYFRNIDNRYLISMTMLGANLNTFGRGDFRNVTTLTIGMFQQHSFRFLAHMNLLKRVTCDWEFGRTYNQQPLTSALDKPSCPSVKEVVLKGLSVSQGDPRRELIFELFPNVIKLTLDDIIITDLQKLPGTQSIFPNVYEHWSKLVMLKIYRIIGLDDFNVMSLRNGRGNVNHMFLTEMVLRLRDLEAFKYESANVSFGDAEAFKFMSLPNLRTLFLRKISMTPLAMDMLQKKLVQFEVEKTCI